MDHMLELARHPDVREALGLVMANHDSPGGDEVAEAAKALAAKDFLALEHPNAWVIEVVHEFYVHPQLAAEVWVKLRYCRTFCRELADIKLREDTGNVKKVRR